MEDFNFRAVDVTLPDVSMEAIEVKIRSFKIYQPGMKYSKEGDITINLLATEDMFVHRLFKEWQDLVVGDGYVIPNRDVWKTSMVIHQLDSKDEIIWEYYAGGIFPTVFTYGDLTADSAEPQQMTIGLSYSFYKDGPPGSVT